MTIESSFLGSWSLESFVATGPDGRLVHPFGEGALGRIQYDAEGRMAVQIMSRGRAPLSVEDPRKAPEAELAAAFGSFLSYLGTYSVLEESSEMLHHIEVASIPNWPGTTQRRRFEFDDGTLILSTPPIVLGGVPIESVLRWVR